jgi:hypothetical protein
MSIREEIQITDLEPSFEGGEDIEYVVQIRGIDAQGRPGPWSEELKFTSPQQIPSLQSFNYIPGEAGWRLDNDGTFDVNDAFIRGTLQSSNFTQGLSGWRLREDGFAEFSSGIFRGALQIGSNTFNVDSNGNMFIGGTTLANSPFAVDTNGNILAASLTASMITSGTLAPVRIPNLDAGKITAGTLGANVVYAGTIVASQIISGTINGARIPNLDAEKIDSGTFDPVRIPNLSANKITTGTLNANNVTIEGSLSAVTLSGVSGTFSGSLTASVTQANVIGNFSGSNLSINASGSGRSLNLFAGANVVAQPSGNVNLFPGGNINLTAGNNTTLSVPTGTGTTVVVASGNALRRSTSSIKYKENIRKAPRLNNLLDVQPVYFNFKNAEDDTQRNVYGVIAEEVDSLGLKELIYYNEGEPESVHYSDIGLALIPYVKELYDRIEELERKINGK